MEAECKQFGGSGIVAVKVHEHNHGWGSHVIEFFAVGTAVTRDPEGGTVTPPSMVLTMDG
jgi:uncharacterized protein YbjQ (UPF0145 family)